MRTVRKLVASVAFLAIAAVVVMFAVSNRAEVAVSLWLVRPGNGDARESKKICLCPRLVNSSIATCDRKSPCGSSL